MSCRNFAWWWWRSVLLGAWVFVCVMLYIRVYFLVPEEFWCFFWLMLAVIVLLFGLWLCLNIMIAIWMGEAFAVLPTDWFSMWMMEALVTIGINFGRGSWGGSGGGHNIMAVRYEFVFHTHAHTRARTAHTPHCKGTFKWLHKEILVNSCVWEMFPDS